jgi:hypothetical protein
MSDARANNAQEQIDEADDAGEDAGPAQTAVTTIAVSAPVPLARPADLGETMQLASLGPRPPSPLLNEAAKVPFDQLFPSAYPSATLPAAAAVAAAARAAIRDGAPVPGQQARPVALASIQPTGRAPQNALGAIASVETPSPVPMPRDDIAVAAYAPIGNGSAAERQMQALIESEPDSAGAAPTNSVASPIGNAALKSYAAARSSGAPQTLASTVEAKAFVTRVPHLVAPDYSASLVRPVALTSPGFAQFQQPIATDLSPATELGPMVVRLGFHGQSAAALSVSRFAPANPLLVAFR